MAENSIPDQNINETNSAPDRSESALPAVSESKSTNPSGGCHLGNKVAITRLSLPCARELTEEEKAEEERRLREVRAGRHPDTGERLKPGDRKTLKPREVYELQIQREATLRRSEVRFQTTIDALERERSLNVIMYGTYFPSDFERAMHDARRHGLGHPVLDNLSIRHQLHASFTPQAIDTSYGKVRNDLCYDPATLTERQCRFVDPLFDRDFVNRITGGVSPDLLRRSTELRDPLAFRTLEETVDKAATARMAEHWRVTLAPPWSSILANEAPAHLGQDTSALFREAERMVSIYGPLVAEQPLFLTEYQSNLGLFHRTGLNVGAFQGADLFARSALPTHLLPGFEDYLTVRVERLREFGEAQLNELGEDFKREPNPYHVLEAFAIAQAYGLEAPDWVLDNLTDMADRVRGLCDEPDVGGTSEAERVGKAVGFSRGGRGTTGWLERASLLRRDKAIYFRVVEWFDEQRLRNSMIPPKLSSAYAEVGAEFRVNVSTVGRIYRRFKRYSSDREETDV
jgi:hypothetical protein